MNYIVPAGEQTIPVIIDRIRTALDNVSSAAEVLEALHASRAVYREAKAAAREASKVSAAKGAHDTTVAAAHRMQADALELEARAKRLLADEYDAAQDRGEIRTRADNQAFSSLEKAGIGDLGLSPKDVHEARQIRDAEVADPGIIRRALDERLTRGQEPNKAYLRQIVTEAAMRGLRPAPTESRRNPDYAPDPAFQAMASVIGSCTSIIEKLASCPPSAIASRLGDGARRATNVGQIRRAHSDLTKLLEVIDAE
jgi:hypothetical protein